MTHTLGVLLAAGAGRRMGGPKAFVIGDDGLPWVVSASRALTDGGCAEVVVVLGASADEAGELLAGEPVSTVVADDWATGMAASVRTGLAAATPTPAVAALIHLVDLPDVGAGVVRRLVDHAEPGVLARAAYAGRAGHPVLMGREHWSGVVAGSAGDRGARDYLDAHDVLLVDCGDLALGLDHDTPEGGGHAQHPR
ncbi:MAG: NTP transferase domain-containing protein [Aeromicrobium sp.]